MPPTDELSKKRKAADESVEKDAAAAGEGEEEERDEFDEEDEEDDGEGGQRSVHRRSDAAWRAQSRVNAPNVYSLVPFVQACHFVCALSEPW